MSAQFWYGLLAFPIAALLAFITVWLAARTWTGLLRLADYLPKRVRKAKGHSMQWVNYLEDQDNRLDQIGIIATAENLHVWNTPFGVFVRAGGRIDNSMSRKLRDLIKDQMIQDAKDDQGDHS